MRRGFTLIAVLLLSALLLVLACAFLLKQSTRYKGARLELERCSARALAWAGLESVRVRLDQDLSFPPQFETDIVPAQFAQRQYNFQESVRDVSGGGQVVGNYDVTIELGWMDRPYNILRVSSVGKPINSEASCRLRAEFDLSSDRESFRLIVLEEDP